MRAGRDDNLAAPGVASPIGFAELADVLAWGGDAAATVAQLKHSYVDCLSYCLGRKLGELHASNSDIASQVLAALDETSETDLVQALLLPTTSRRLVTPLHDLDDVVRHLLDVLPNPPHPESRPGYLGYLLDVVPVYAEPCDAKLEGVRVRIGRLLDQVRLQCGPSLPYLQAVMRELHLHMNPSQDGFFSNSPQGLVGCAILTNPHLDLVDDVVLIEAVVHEATHGFVGMSEAVGLSGVNPTAIWLLDDQPYDGVSRVASPWTGRNLDIPTYLHACFVWWGLLHFWSDMAGGGIFDESRVRSRILRAATGFLGQGLVRELLPYREIVQPTLLECLSDLGRQVDEVLSGSGLSEIITTKGRR